MTISPRPIGRSSKSCFSRATTTLLVTSALVGSGQPLGQTREEVKAALADAGAYVTAVALLEQAGTSTCAFALENRDQFDTDRATREVINTIPPRFRHELQGVDMANWTRQRAKVSIAQGIASVERKIADGADRNTSCGLFVGGLFGLFTSAKDSWIKARARLGP